MIVFLISWFVVLVLFEVFILAVTAEFMDSWGEFWITTAVSTGIGLVAGLVITGITALF